MEIEKQKKLVNHIFRLLKVNEIVIPIGRTNKGNLGIKFTEGQEDFEMYLDAVPLSTKSFLEDDNNIELKKMLEKYLWEPEQRDFTYNGFKGIGKGLEEIVDNGTTHVNVEKIVDVGGNDVTDKFFPKNKGGRPRGSKNKVK